jgi:hypothetical protein
LPAIAVSAKLWHDSHSYHIATNFAQIITTEGKGEQAKSIGRLLQLQTMEIVATKRKRLELPSEGKGRMFESSRARHDSNDLG